jgi:hypothetical protein
MNAADSRYLINNILQLNPSYAESNQSMNVQPFLEPDLSPLECGAPRCTTKLIPGNAVLRDFAYLELWKQPLPAFQSHRIVPSSCIAALRIRRTHG